MKKGYKECPFCANEIKEEAIKCQYCHEFLNKDVAEDSKKECPFCMNEVDANVDVCPFCDEKLTEDSSKKETVKKTSMGNASGLHRFYASLLDLIITYTLIGGIANVVMILGKKRTTLGCMIIGIETVNNEGNKPSRRQSALRYLVFYNTFFLTLFIVAFLIFIPFGILSINVDTAAYNMGYYGFFVYLIILVMNFIEVFSYSPTFVDKWLGIKRIKQQK